MLNHVAGVDRMQVVQSKKFAKTKKIVKDDSPGWEARSDRLKVKSRLKTRLGFVCSNSTKEREEKGS